MSVHYVPAKPGGRAPTPDILGAVLTAEEKDVTETAEIMNGLAWDYTQAGDNAKTVIEHTVEIKRSERRASEAIIEAGKHLVAVKELLPHGAWLGWLETEFKMSDRTARNMMSIATKFGAKSETVSDLNVSVLYLLAGDSVPEEAREEVIQRAAAGETVTKAAAKAVIEASKPKAEHTVNGWFASKPKATAKAVIEEHRPAVQPVVVDVTDERYADGDDERPVTPAMRAAQRAIWNWLADQCGAAAFKEIVDLAEALHFQESAHPLWFRMYPHGADIDDVFWALEACIDQAAAAVPEYAQQTAAFVPTANLKAAVIYWLRENYPDYYGQVAALQCMIADPMHDEDVQRMEPTLPAPYRKDDLLVAMMQASAYLDSLKDDEPEEGRGARGEEEENTFPTARLQIPNPNWEAGRQPDPEPEHDLDCYDDELARPAARRMNELHTLKVRFQETIDLLPKFGVLTGHYVDTNPAKRALQELIGVLDDEMDALAKGAKAEE